MNKITTLNAGEFALDGGAMFGVVPKVLWSRAYSEGDDKNRIPLSARVLLIRQEGKNILVDTGNGTKLPEKTKSIYDINEININDELKKINLSSSDINYVILTHLHFDHSGGATEIINNEIVPAFPNAKYYVQKDHWDWAINPTEKDRASFINDNYVPLKNHGVIEFLDGNGEIFPGIELINVNGHTKAMQMVKIRNDDGTFLFCTDLCPTSAHLKAPFVMGYDNYPLTALEEKKKFIGMAYEENWTLIFEHDRFTVGGKVATNEKGFYVSEKVEI